SANVFRMSAQDGEAERKLFEEIKAKAETGDAEAQYSFGAYYAYYGGKFVPKDLSEAARWWRKAADQGHAGAQRNLGYCYETGAGVTNDMIEAVRWYREAADKGLADAQLALGSCYGDGKGLIKDEAEAAKWYRKAAEQGLAAAQ